MGNLEIPTKFIITNGQIEVDLVGGPIMIDDWTPASPEMAGSGIYQRVVGTVIDTLSLKAAGNNPNSVIGEIRKLERLSQQALEYKNSRWQTNPVWIEKQGRGETESLFALVLNGRIPEGENPFGQYFQQKWWHFGAVWSGFSWVFEHLIWGSTRPLTGDTLLFNTHAVVSLISNGALDSWLSSTNLASWTEIGTVTQNTDLIYVDSGLYSAKLESGTITQDMSGSASNELYYARARVFLVSGSARISLYDSSSSVPLATAQTTNTGWSTIEVSAEQTLGGSVGVLIYASGVAYVDSIEAGYLVGASSANEIAPRSPIALSNKFTTSGITHIYTYVGSSWNATNLITSYGIGMAGTAVNDAIYFGTRTTAANPGPFNNIVAQLDTLAEDITYVWEYWDGSVWTGVANLSSDKSLSANEFSVVSWEPESDWTAGALDTVAPAGGPAITALWVRCRTSAVGASPVAAVTSNSETLYTTAWNYLATDRIKGDIRSVMRLILNQKYDTGGGDQMGVVYAGARSSDRGAGFQSFLNISDVGNKPGISCGIGSGSLVADPSYPTGKRWTTTLTAPGSDNLNITITGKTAAGFGGEHRVFAVSWIETGDGDVTVQFQYTAGGVTYIRDALPVTAGVELQKYYVWDFGNISIPVLPENLAAPITLRLNFLNTSVTTTHDIDMMAFVLIPTDEWSGEFFNLNPPTAADIYIDSLSTQGKQRRIISYALNTSQVTVLYTSRTGDSMGLSPRNGDQFVYLFWTKRAVTGGFSIDTMRPWHVVQATIDNQDIYLLNRGDDLL